MKTYSCRVQRSDLVDMVVYAVPVYTMLSVTASLPRIGKMRLTIAVQEERAFRPRFGEPSRDVLLKVVWSVCDPERALSVNDRAVRKFTHRPR